jgi:hypothetical protein
VDEFLVEIGVKHSVDSMVEKSVPNRSFVNIARLGVRDVEGVVRRVFVGLILEV